MVDTVQEWLREMASGMDISLSDHQLEQYEAYYRLLVEWNEKMNLTGITEREAVYEKHFYDSLTVAFVPETRKAASLADIGSGAGFPSIPLKIAFPHLRITIVDSLSKRIRFLETVAAELHLTNVTLIHGRAEDVARLPAHRDQYHVVTARAVARLAGLNELCLPFTKPSGVFIAMKGSDNEQEIEESQYSIQLLRARFRGVESLTLPKEKSIRQLVVIEKITPTPKLYPRKAGTPLKDPLIHN